MANLFSLVTIDPNLRQIRLGNTILVQDWDSEVVNSTFVGSIQADVISGRNGSSIEMNSTVQISDMDLSGLPTTDPHVNGRAWNDANVMRVSEG